MITEPVRNPGVVISERLLWQGIPSYVLKEPNSGRYIRINEREYRVWEHLDGKTSLETVSERLGIGTASLAYVRLVELVHRLKQAGFVLGPMSDELGWRRPTRPRERDLTGLTFPWTGVDHLLSAMHQCVGPLLYSRSGGLAMALIAVGGLSVLFRHSPANHGDTPVLVGEGFVRFFIFSLLSLTLTIIHEFAHALTLKHYGGNVRELGVMIYYGRFLLYTNTSDSWMLPRLQRVLVSAAGPLSHLVIGGASALVAMGLGPGRLQDLLVGFSSFAYVTCVLNLNPLLEYDGYYMLCDALDMPNLRSRALAYWRTLLRRTSAPWRGQSTWEGRILLLYGPMAFAWVVFVAFTLLATWENMFRALNLQGLPVGIKMLVVISVAGLPGLQWLSRQWRRRRKIAE